MPIDHGLLGVWELTFFDNKKTIRNTFKEIKLFILNILDLYFVNEFLKGLLYEVL
jgi:hypothetical protein